MNIIIITSVLWFFVTLGYVTLTDVDEWNLKIIASLLSVPVLIVFVTVLLVGVK